MVAIEYRGDLAALASRERFHIVAPWLALRPPGDPDLRFVAYMCLAYSAFAPEHPHVPFSSTFAERWARAALIDRRALVESGPDRDVELAVRLNVPLEQVALARAELVDAT